MDEDEIVKYFFILYAILAYKSNKKLDLKSEGFY